jgi:hypothetical protein
MDGPVRGSGRCRSMKCFDHSHECGLGDTEVCSWLGDTEVCDMYLSPPV